MKLALLGHGRMGRIVEAQARAAGHEVGAIVTSRNRDQAGDLLRGHDIAIDFSAPGAVLAHVQAAVAAGVPLVEGTTGWQAQEGEVRRLIEQRGTALVYGPNFSIGANLFFRIVASAAELVRGAAGYDPFIEEAHHAGKRDAPSGTALLLKDILERQFGRTDISVASTRAGSIPGVHRVGFDSPGDEILLTHTARSREGCAAGALLAARWVLGRKGAYSFAQVLDDVLTQKREAV